MTARWLRTQAPLARELWALAWPAITHMLLITTMFLASRVMAGHYSANALASLQISGSLTWSVYALFTAFSAGALAVVARSVGARDRSTAARAARASVLFALALGVLVAAPIRIANGALLHAIFPRESAAVLADASAYLHIVLPALPLAFVEAIAAASLQGSGDTRTPLVIALIGNVVNLAASSVLMFGLLGAPELGIRGAAIGNAATMTIEGCLLAAALLSRGSGLPLRDLSRDREADRTALARVLRVSAPAFAEKAAYQSGFLAFVAIIGLLGDEAMAANQALVAIEAVCFLSADGFGIATGAVVAQKLGAGKPDEAERAGWIGAAMATLVLTVIGVCFGLAPTLLVGGFSPDPEIIKLGASALRVAAVAQPFMAFAMVTSMGLRGAGATRTVLAATVVCAVVVRLAATWFFAITLRLGLVGVWMGSTADWMVRTVILGAAYRAGGWKRATV